MNLRFLSGGESDFLGKSIAADDMNEISPELIMLLEVGGTMIDVSKVDIIFRERHTCERPS